MTQNVKGSQIVEFANGQIQVQSSIHAPFVINGTTLKGDKGDKGNTGDTPDHQWQGTALQFSDPHGNWGAAVNLKGDKGDPGDAPIKGVDYFDGESPTIQKIYAPNGLGLKNSASSVYLGIMGVTGGVYSQHYNQRWQLRWGGADAGQSVQGFFGQSQINSSLLVELIDTQDNDRVLDSVTLFDAIDGTDGEDGFSVVMVPISADQTQFWHRNTDNIWTPSHTSIEFEVVFKQGNFDLSKSNHTILRTGAALHHSGYMIHNNGGYYTEIIISEELQTSLTLQVKLWDSASKTTLINAWSRSFATCIDGEIGLRGASAIHHHVIPISAAQQRHWTRDSDYQWTPAATTTEFDVVFQRDGVDLSKYRQTLVRTNNYIHYSGYMIHENAGYHTEVVVTGQDTTSVTLQVLLWEDPSKLVLLDSYFETFSVSFDGLKGQSGNHGIFIGVEFNSADQNRVWRQDFTGDWEPSNINIDFEVVFKQGAVDLSRSQHVVQRNGATLAHSGSVYHDNGGYWTNFLITGENTGVLTLRVDLWDSPAKNLLIMSYIESFAVLSAGQVDALHQDYFLVPADRAIRDTVATTVAKVNYTTSNVDRLMCFEPITLAKRVSTLKNERLIVNVIRDTTTMASQSYFFDAFDPHTCVIMVPPIVIPAYTNSTVKVEAMLAEASAGLFEQPANSLVSAKLIAIDQQNKITPS